MPIITVEANGALSPLSQRQSDHLRSAPAVFTGSLAASRSREGGRAHARHNVPVARWDACDNHGAAALQPEGMKGYVFIARKDIGIAQPVVACRHAHIMSIAYYMDSG